MDTPTKLPSLPANSTERASDAPPSCAVATGSEITSTRVHMCLCVSGALRNMTKRQLRGLFTRDDGTQPPAEEVRDYLKSELEKGHRVIPIGKCDDFDWITGCRGHPVFPNNTGQPRPKDVGL